MLKQFFKVVAAAVAFAFFAAPAAAEDGPAFTFADLAFLKGHWRGGDDFVFEETWTAAEGGVMTAMARGVSKGALRVLEYIVVSEEAGRLVMRFKHYNADFSTWEEDGPVTLLLTAASDNDVTFTADPPSETVKTIRYWMPEEDMLQADVVLVEDGEEGGFSLKFDRVY